MRKIFSNKILLLAALALITILLPSLFVERAREGTVALFAPLWQRLSFDIPWKKRERRLELTLKKLETENQLLRDALKKRKLFEEELAESRNLYSDLIDQKIKVVTAHIIYRDPKNWGSSLWVNVGEETNLRAGEKVIQKNSPVLSGRSAVGLVDYVGKKASRIRLITDSAVKPSVQVARGALPRQYVKEAATSLLFSLEKDDISFPTDIRNSLLNSISALQSHLVDKERACYFAKGVLQGSSPSLPLSKKARLKGFGFHGDDSEGILIREGDLLVTNGLDGVFPSDLPVAFVTKVYPLREGECMYEIEAKSCVGELDSLSTLFILPSFESEEASCYAPKG